ncbi:hypothetical protein E4U26_008132 [Claviceps purpurea]|nr:hypothetical protein E4U26_008132 [Claviceps purpurea]
MTNQTRGVIVLQPVVMVSGQRSLGQKEEDNKTWERERGRKSVGNESSRVLEAAGVRLQHSTDSGDLPLTAQRGTSWFAEFVSSVGGPLGLVAGP